MPNCPLLRSRLVAALAKRTLLASSRAFLRSSAVRSGARLNINGLVYHRHEQPGGRKSAGVLANSLSEQFILSDSVSSLCDVWCEWDSRTLPRSGAASRSLRVQCRWLDVAGPLAARAADRLVGLSGSAPDPEHL